MGNSTTTILHQLDLIGISKKLKNRSIATFFGFIIALFSTYTLYGQFEQLSYPVIHHYSKQEHGGGTQTWDIEHLDNGISFFANNDGVLFFDRISWQLFKTPKKTIIRSLAYHKSSERLYIGGQGELGYFNLESYPYTYQDVLPLLDEDQKLDLTDIWELVPEGDKIYFRASDKIFTFYDDTFEVYDPTEDITFIQWIDEELLYNRAGTGVYAYKNGTHRLLSDEPELASTQIIEALDLPGPRHLLLTNKNGIYVYEGGKYKKWVTNAEELLKESLIQSAFLWSDRNWVCVGTFLSGLMIFNMDGQLVQIIDKEKGLQNNTISAINADSSNNLWIGSFLGIAALPMDQEKQKIYPDGNLQGAIYDIEEWNDHYYFASSNGLYALEKKDYYPPSKKNPFYLIKGSEGECWGLDVIDDQLYVAHNRGAFIVSRQNKLQSLPSSQGVWRFLPLGAQHMAVGTYEGIEVLRNSPKGWEYAHKLDSLNISARILVKTSDSSIWLTHPYKGIYRIQLGADLQTHHIERIESGHGIENLNNCYGHSWNEQFLVSNDTAIYAYDEDLDTFIRDPQFNQIFENERLIRILHQGENTYYISDASAGKLVKDITGSMVKLKKESVVENNKTFIGGFENLKLFRDHFFICTDQGVIIRKQHKDSPRVDLLIQKLIIEPSDSIHYLTKEDRNSVLVLDNNTTGFRIDYTALGKDLSLAGLEYSSRMKGLGNEWSEWTSSQTKTFNNLWAGDYTFELKARYNGKELGKTLQQVIKVESHILWSNMAKSIYIFIFLSLLFLAVFIPTQKQKKEKKKILQEKRKADSEVLDLKKKNYNIQIEAKNKELASSTMHLLQKNELITDVKEVITDIKNKVKDREAKKELKKLENKLKDDQRLEDDWENFFIHFNKVHDNFFDRLKEAYPDLTPKDLKLCAYLRLNLSTKEMAPLLGISIRGVEVSRYRLRKKLDLESEVNLNEFMMSF